MVIALRAMNDGGCAAAAEFDGATGERGRLALGMRSSRKEAAPIEEGVPEIVCPAGARVGQGSDRCAHGGARPCGARHGTRRARFRPETQQHIRSAASRKNEQR